MTTSTDKPQGTVQYFDSAWGGWRRLTAFGDAPRDTWALATAKRKARELSSHTHRRVRVLSSMQFVAEYSRGSKVR